jgi:hypothetical protein
MGSRYGKTEIPLVKRWSCLKHYLGEWRTDVEYVMGSTWANFWNLKTEVCKACVNIYILIDCKAILIWSWVDNSIKTKARTGL